MRIITFILNAALVAGIVTLFLAFVGAQSSVAPQPPQPPQTVEKLEPVSQPVATQALTSPAAKEIEEPLAAAQAPVAIAETAAPEEKRLEWSAVQQASAPLSPEPEPPASVATATIPVSAPEAAQPAAPAPAPDSAAASPAIKKTAVAKDLFGAVKEPANLASRSIGFYAHGCLAGAKPLAVNGPAWQVMRLSRNRNWGHPSLIKYIERFAKDAKEKDGWPGLLIGDLSMPRGGPMPFGHASHQVGLDVDIWYKPEPNRELTPKEREDMKMESFLSDPGHVNPQVWKPEFEQLLRRAVSYPQVARIFVNPAIKKWLCDNSKGDRSFLRKVTPIMGHDDHFHVRMVCPADNPGCENQHTNITDEGCGKGLDKWIESLMKPKPSAHPGPASPTPAMAKPAAPSSKSASVKPGLKAVFNKKKQPLTMAQLPPECEAVLKAAPAAALSVPVTAAR
jgi:penicillin-insensitive murein endopeptidase